MSANLVVLFRKLGWRISALHAKMSPCAFPCWCWELGPRDDSTRFVSPIDPNIQGIFWENMGKLYSDSDSCFVFFGITLWLFNIAMENGPFIDGFPIKTSIYKGFSMAMLINQMVDLSNCLFKIHRNSPWSVEERSPVLLLLPRAACIESKWRL